jgi:hypothetical protein
MAELAATRAEVEAAVAADAACAAAVELEALRASSTDNPVSANDDRDNELKLAREAAWEQAAQWGARSGCAPDDGGSLDRRGRTGGWVDKIAAFIGGAALPPRTGTVVTMGSRPLSGTSVPAAGGLPSPRPTTSSGPR